MPLINLLLQFKNVLAPISAILKAYGAALKNGFTIYKMLQSNTELIVSTTYCHSERGLVIDNGLLLNSFKAIFQGMTSWI